MNNVSFLRFLNMSASAIQSELLLLVSDLELVEGGRHVRPDLCPSVSPRLPRGSFAADIALEARRSAVIFRPYFKPDLSAFEPFYQQLDLFSL